MIAARIARAPVPRRSLLDRLLLDGMPYTNARPWIGIVGAAVTVLTGALVISRWLS